MTTVGIVSPGAMGSAIGDRLRRGGARVVATLAGRSARTGRLARDAGLELLPSLGEVVAVSDVVLSIVPPDRAEAVAAELGAARLLADLNAVSPETARRISGEVDGSISGPPPLEAGTTRIYLSGPRAGEAAGLPFDGVEVIVVGEEVGLASAVKMSTASVYKGSVALLVQARGRPLRRPRARARRPRAARGRRRPPDRAGGGEVGAVRRRDARDRGGAGGRRSRPRAVRG